MKFLFTVASYYPAVGGVQMVTQCTAEELVRQGHEVTVLISHSDNIYEQKTLNNVQLMYYDLRTEKDKIIGDKTHYVQFLTELCKNVDVLINVSVHSALTDAILPYIKKLNCKKILYLHGIYDFKWSKQDKSSIIRILSKIYYNLRRSYFYSKLYKFAKNYDYIIHLSEDDISMKYMKRHGITQNLVIHNSAERAFFEPPALKCNEKYFLQVANYAEHKNQEYSLEAFYKSKCKNIKMVYIGSNKNSYYEHLIEVNKKLIKKYGEKTVEFLTDMDRNDIIEKFKHATAIILSSRVEKFPMVLVEGLACGVPFISTDCGSVKSLPGGFVIDSIDEMAECMEKLETTSNIIIDLKEKGYEYAYQNFSLEKNIKALIEKLEE